MRPCVRDNSSAFMSVVLLVLQRGGDGFLCMESFVTIKKMRLTVTLRTSWESDIKTNSNVCCNTLV